MKRTAISASTANGTDIMNRSAVATPYAFWTAATASGGSSAMFGTVLPPDEAPPGFSVSVTLLARIAPSTLTPIVPPMLRKKLTAEVAAPVSRAGTSFCAASTRFCITSPIPTPSTTMKPHSVIELVCASIVPNSASPIGSSTLPTTR